MIYIVLRIGGDRPIHDVELGWVTPDQAYLLSCRSMPAEVAASCVHDGDLYLFGVLVGTGARGFVARATTIDGTEVTTEAREIWLE